MRDQFMPPLRFVRKAKVILVRSRFLMPLVPLELELQQAGQNSLAEGSTLFDRPQSKAFSSVSVSIGL